MILPILAAGARQLQFCNLEALMPLNLVQHRGEPNVWDFADDRSWDSERWLIALMAGAFLVSGLRRRSPAGLMFVIGGGCLAWWAAAGADERRGHIGRVRAAMPSRRVDVDLVHETSEESFPASDAPSWTPTTGNTGPSDRGRAH
jgi:hypothetical protein